MGWLTEVLPFEGWNVITLTEWGDEQLQTADGWLTGVLPFEGYTLEADTPASLPREVRPSHSVSQPAPVAEANEQGVSSDSDSTSSSVQVIEDAPTGPHTPPLLPPPP